MPGRVAQTLRLGQLPEERTDSGEPYSSGANPWMILSGEPSSSIVTLALNPISAHHNPS